MPLSIASSSTTRILTFIGILLAKVKNYCNSA
jgi:hypothetical protein